MDTQPLIRQLQAGDAAAFRALRLMGLVEAPTAFGSSYAAEKDRTVDDFAEIIGRNHMVGALVDGKLAGVAGFYQLAGEKTAHSGKLWGVYVDPAYRKRGIARLVVQAVLAHAKGVVLQVYLAAVSENEGALRLYRSLGFIEYGVEPRALRVGTQFFDEHLMVWRAD